MWGQRNNTIMKQIFKLFLKENKIETVAENAVGLLTTAFNSWVGQVKTDDKYKNKRYAFKAHTTKLTIRKWCDQMHILKGIQS